MGKELYTNIPSKVGDLISDVKNGRIGLPDLQRPFVWKDNKVRDLLDSMLRGFPTGPFPGCTLSVSGRWPLRYRTGSVLRL